MADKIIQIPKSRFANARMQIARKPVSRIPVKTAAAAKTIQTANDAAIEELVEQIQSKSANNPGLTPLPNYASIQTVSLSIHATGAAIAAGARLNSQTALFPNNPQAISDNETEPSGLSSYLFLSLPINRGDYRVRYPTVIKGYRWKCATNLLTIKQLRYMMSNSKLVLFRNQARVGIDQPLNMIKHRVAFESASAVTVLSDTIGDEDRSFTKVHGQSLVFSPNEDVAFVWLPDSQTEGLIDGAIADGDYFDFEIEFDSALYSPANRQ